MGKLTKEEIILLFLEDPYKLADEIWNKNVPKSDEIRTLICDLGSLDCAYWYARNIDKSPHPDTRREACKDSKYAYYYAACVDKEPRSDTRSAACKDPVPAHCYARDVDKSPRSDTRHGACKDPYCKKEYEEWEKECSLKKT